MTPRNGPRVSRSRLCGICLCLALLGTGSRTLAQRAVTIDPLVGPEQFTEYRNLSGLAGGGYGVNAQGYGSLSGPVSLSTPVAHVLGRGQLRLEAAEMSFTSSPAFGNRETNGTAVITYGHTLGRFNVALTEMILTSDLNQAMNLQASYIPSGSSHWVGSLGVQGLIGANKSTGNGDVNARSSRSFFGVATYRLDTGRAPVYLSGGFGTRRFKDGFVSASFQALQPLRVWAEYDGFGINEGVLLAWRKTAEGHGPEVNVGIGYVKSRYFLWSAGIGF